MAAGAFIGLGSNLGDGPAQLDQALSALVATPNIRLLAVSSYYRTPPWGLTDQADFTNAVAHIECRLTAIELLGRLQAIEDAGGRQRDPDPSKRWGPRRLDLDLLLFNAHIIDSPQLQVPHPLISQRAFVLVPLVDLVDDIDIPGQGSAREALAALPAGDKAGLQRLEHVPWQPPKDNTDCASTDRET